MRKLTIAGSVIASGLAALLAIGPTVPQHRHLPADLIAHSGSPSSTTYYRGDGAWATPSGGGTGTVTTFSLATANGFSGSVANATTTPALTINQLAFSSLSGIPTTIAGYGLTDALKTSNNLSDLASASTARTNLGLGTLATQSGTFSGTSSGTNTGDQTLSGLGISTCYITSPVSQNSNPAAWADVTGLSFSLASGHTYLFEFEALTVGSATTNWARYGVNGPSQSLLVVNVVRANVTAGTGNQASTATAYDTGTDITSTNNTGSLPVRITGVITTTASGTLILRQRNTTAGAAVTTNAGSWGRLTLLN